MLSKLAKNRTHSDKTKALISRALVGDNNPFYNKNHSVESKLRIIEAKSGYSVYIYNTFRELLVIFPSVRSLAKLINSNHSTIVGYIKNKTLFRGEWYLTNVPFNLTDTPLIPNWSLQESSTFSKKLLIIIILKRLFLFIIRIEILDINLKRYHTPRKN